jgi:hypothetical protein
MEPRLGVVVLAWEAEVEGNFFAVPVGVLVHFCRAEGLVASALDRGPLLVGQELGGAQVVIVDEVEFGLGYRGRLADSLRSKKGTDLL